MHGQQNVKIHLDCLWRPLSFMMYLGVCFLLWRSASSAGLDSRLDGPMSVSTKLRRPAEPEISQMWLHFLKGVKQPKWEAEKASTTPIIRRLTSIPPQPQHAFLAKLLKYLLQSSGKNVDIKILLEGRNTVS